MPGTKRGLLRALAPRAEAVEIVLGQDVERIRCAHGLAAADDAQRAVIEALCDLLTRPAKRVRSALMCAVAEAYGRTWDEAVGQLCVALEWMQVYLLVHDDWMDNDDTRRGGPSVPAVMRLAFPRHADAAAVLAGDLAKAFSEDALARAVAAGAPWRAFTVFAHMHSDVVLGQLSDVLERGESLAQIERRYAQKTASYTTVGPMRLGALFASSNIAPTEVDRSALALGIAFQIRDDINGRDRDNREDKNTWLRVCARPGAEALQAAEQRTLELVQEAKIAMPAALCRGPGSEVIFALCTYLTGGV